MLPPGRLLEGERPYPRIDATRVRVRGRGRVVGAAAMAAAGRGHRRPARGARHGHGPFEAGPCRTDSPRPLAGRGWRGVRLAVADDREGRRAAAGKPPHAALRGCRARRVRDPRGRVPAGPRARAALPRTIFAQGTAEAARERWREVAGSLRERSTAGAALTDGAGPGALAHRALAEEPWPRLASTDPLERVSGGIKRRADAAGVFPDPAAVVGPVGATLLERHEERALARRSTTRETLRPSADAELVGPPAVWSADQPSTRTANQPSPRPGARPGWVLFLVVV